MKEGVIRVFALCLAVGVLASSGCSTDERHLTIGIAPAADPLEVLAAKELRRYWYLTSGQLAEIQAVEEPSATDPDQVILCTEGTPFSLLVEGVVPWAIVNSSGDQGYQVISLGNRGTGGVLVRGASHLGTLYGAYRLIEALGVRFYPDGDVLPEIRKDLRLPFLNLVEAPAFRLRGIQPFHDFPEGPDWWNLDDYKAIIAQLAKMRMNFIGFHTYPSKPFDGAFKPEPMVWIGLEDQVSEGGEVRSAYPVMHFHTGDQTWGYDSMRTSAFHLGGSLLFDRDDYGADYMAGISPWPHRQEENIRIFDQFGRLQRSAFGFARKLGVQTCVGTETPLTLPEPVQAELLRRGMAPDSEDAVRAVYRGIFTRIMKAHSLDYYWFWTPESWTWDEIPDEEVDQTRKDLRIAFEVARELGVPFELATSGWVLGPPKNRAQFDQELPKDIAFSCINREVGFTPVEEGFARVEGRSKWAIPWLEDDPALTAPQLWVGRVRRDARDAIRYGCDGLLGIHWRTRPLGPAFGALAQAGWSVRDWSDAPGGRDLASDDFYLDWAVAQFGTEAGPAAAGIFTQLDGGPLYQSGQGPRQANLFRPADWAGKGPGGVLVNEKPWSEVEPRFAFVEELAALEPRVKGAAALERFDYWLNLFRYSRQMAKVGCTLGELKAAVDAVQKESSPEQIRSVVVQQILPIRERAAREWSEMVNLLLRYVSTTGGMGTIANLEQHNLANLKRLTEYDGLLEKLMGEPPPKLELESHYQGPDRLFLPTRRGTLERGEDLRLEAVVLSQDRPGKVVLHWRPLGDGNFSEEDFTSEERGVYRIILESARFGDSDIEYFVEAKMDGSVLVAPPSAPVSGQTVLVW
jgi:hypothetical protein